MWLKPRTGVPRVDTRWCGWYPVRPINDFAFWYEVAKRVKEKRIRRKNREKILNECVTVDLEMTLNGRT